MDDIRGASAAIYIAGNDTVCPKMPLHLIDTQLTITDRHNSSTIRPLSYEKPRRTSKGTSRA